LSFAFGIDDDHYIDLRLYAQEIVSPAGADGRRVSIRAFTVRRALPSGQVEHRVVRVRLRDTDDLEALTSERDSLADDRWIRAVPGPPRLVREHDDRYPAASRSVVRPQQSPEGRPRPEQLEVVAGHEQAARGD
jgi:hypothetical protein